MGDQDDGEPALLAKLAQQLQDLGLHRHVQGGGRLVGDEQARPAGERAGDHHPLAHAAAELMGIGIDPALGIGDPHIGQELDGPPARGRGVQALMDPQHLADLAADGHQRIEMGRGILEDHGDALAAELGKPGLIEGQHVLRPRSGCGRRGCAHSRRAAA